MKSVEELRSELSLVFKGLKDGTIKREEAAELANVAGKMISSAKVQCMYYELRGEAPSISFLDSTPSK